MGFEMLIMVGNNTSKAILESQQKTIRPTQRVYHGAGFFVGITESDAKFRQANYGRFRVLGNERDRQNVLKSIFLKHYC